MCLFITETRYLLVISLLNRHILFQRLILGKTWKNSLGQQSYLLITQSPGSHKISVASEEHW